MFIVFLPYNTLFAEPRIDPAHSEGSLNICWAAMELGGGFPCGAAVKNLPANTGDTRDTSSIPGLGRSLEEANGNTLQYSFWENPMDRGAWQTTVHEVKSGTRLSEQQQQLAVPCACMSPPSSSPRPISQMQPRKVQAEMHLLQPLRLASREQGTLMKAGGLLLPDCYKFLKSQPFIPTSLGQQSPQSS